MGFSTKALSFFHIMMYNLIYKWVVEVDALAIQYIEGMLHTDGSRYAFVDLEDLFLDVDNPRFASSSLLSREGEAVQREIINYLVKYGEVCELAFEIDKNHGLFAEDIMSGYIQNGKVVVLEGNRRLSACKLLMDSTLMDAHLAGLHPLPTAQEETKINLQKVLVIIYGDSRDAQKYIASKHTQPNIKKWTTIEQYNYYFTQFNNGKTPSEIAQAVGITKVKSIGDKIRQYILFDTMFKLVKNTYPDVESEATSILPVVTVFMPKLLGKKGKYVLDVEYDESTFKYTPLKSQEELFARILFLIGEAFFARPEAKKKIELTERATGSAYRISSDEIKGR